MVRLSSAASASPTLIDENAKHERMRYRFTPPVCVTLEDVGTVLARGLAREVGDLLQPLAVAQVLRLGLVEDHRPGIKAELAAQASLGGLALDLKGKRSQHRLDDVVEHPGLAGAVLGSDPQMRPPWHGAADRRNHEPAVEQPPHAFAVLPRDLHAHVHETRGLRGAKRLAQAHIQRAGLLVDAGAR